MVLGTPSQTPIFSRGPRNTSWPEVSNSRRRNWLRCHLAAAAAAAAAIALAAAAALMMARVEAAAVGMEMAAAAVTCQQYHRQRPCQQQQQQQQQQHGYLDQHHKQHQHSQLQGWGTRQASAAPDPTGRSRALPTERVSAGVDLQPAPSCSYDISCDIYAGHSDTSTLPAAAAAAAAAPGCTCVPYCKQSKRSSVPTAHQQHMQHIHIQ